MNKRILIPVAALALLAAPFAVFAAPDAGFAPPPFSAEDAGAFTDARVAGLKAGLKLTPDQEKNWPQLEAAIRDNAKAHDAHIAEWREHGTDALKDHDAIAVMRRHAQALAARSAEIEKLAQAAAPLYASLDAPQKHRFNVMLRHAAQERMRHAMLEGRFGGFGGPHGGPEPR
jgi:zinc resistance-associated protein